MWQWPTIEARLTIEQGKFAARKETLAIEQGKFVLRKENPLFALLNVDVDPGRIRECRICQRIFWARKITTRTCSDRCGNTWNQRLFRVNSTEYEANRARKNEERDRAARIKKLQR